MSSCVYCYVLCNIHVDCTDGTSENTDETTNNMESFSSMNTIDFVFLVLVRFFSIKDWGALKNRGNLNVQDFLDAMTQFTATVNGASDNLGTRDNTLNMYVDCR
jgi:hypothetical protein